MIWWPVVQQRLVVLLPTLTGWADVVVHDGPATIDRGAARSIVVGGTNPPDGGPVDAGSFEFVEEGITFSRAERGTVVSELVLWGGDDALPTYRTSAFDLIDELDDAIRTDETLGVLPVSSTTSLSVDVVSAQDTSGATQRLVISVTYFTRS